MTRKIMQSSQYRMIFPNVELDKKAVDHIRTSKGGYRYATSIGSDITGFGADEIIIDDPMQPAATHSCADAVAAHAQRRELGGMHDAVLAPRDVRQSEVEDRRCRTRVTCGVTHVRHLRVCACMSGS